MVHIWISTSDSTTLHKIYSLFVVLFEPFLGIWSHCAHPAAPHPVHSKWVKLHNAGYHNWEVKSLESLNCLMAFCEQTNFNSDKKRICNCSFLRKVQRQEPVWMGTFMKKNKGHATRASLPPHLSCIMNFVANYFLVRNYPRFIWKGVMKGNV